MHQIRINGPVYAALAEEACTQAGVQLHFYEIPTQVLETDRGWKIETVGKNLRRTILTKQLIDCTGGANIVGQIGFPRLREERNTTGHIDF